MIDTTIPGIKAKHAIITPTCLVNRGPQGAFEEAVERMRIEFRELLKCRKDNPEFHLVLTVNGDAEKR